VLAEHTVQYLWLEPRQTCLRRILFFALLTADNDPPFGHRSGPFRSMFPINARKTQESIETEKPDQYGVSYARGQELLRIFTTVS
jgi:hypothetical protein